MVITGLRANGVTSDIVGINSNYGDVATISSSCGVSKKVCQEFKGILKADGGESTKLTTTSSCKGVQGTLAKLPAC